MENMRRLGLIRPRDLVPSPSLGGPPAAGRQRVFVGSSGSAVACSLDCGWSLAIAGVHRAGAVCRAQPSCPAHLPYTSRACSISNAILTIRKLPGWHVVVVPGATEVTVHAVFVGSRLIGGPLCSDDSVSTVL